MPPLPFWVGGTVIRGFELDGSPQSGVPASLQGDHTIEITLGG